LFRGADAQIVISGIRKDPNDRARYGPSDRTGDNRIIMGYV